MNKTVIAEKYLVNTQEILKTKTSFTNVSEIEKYLITNIKNHPIATYISTFDHYAHTNSLEGGRVPPNLKAAINVLCCFGMAIPNAVFVGVKPMSIGVVETPESFILSFAEAPAPSAQQAMQDWVAGIANK